MLVIVLVLLKIISVQVATVIFLPGMLAMNALELKMLMKQDTLFVQWCNIRVKAIVVAIASVGDDGERS